MLSKEDNELMCRVGPGMPMGNLMREYWIPGLLSEELPAPDTGPFRLKLLGENLVAFRDSSGRAAIFADRCPHRNTAMFYARNEEGGLRCVHHGWKFDVTGACTDVPSEPAESNFKRNVRIRSYPCQERNGIVWTYMGPRESPPPLPDLPPNLDENCVVTIQRMQYSNYVQCLEGNIDIVHAGFLHFGHIKEFERDLTPRSAMYYWAKYRSQVRVEARDLEVGASYAAVFPTDDADQRYWAFGHFLMPFYLMNAPGLLGQKQCLAWVPVDDEHTMMWAMSEPKFTLPDSTSIGGLKLGTFAPTGPRQPKGMRAGAQIPNSLLENDPADYLGRFRLKFNPANRYLIDRDEQRQGVSYTGIPSVHAEDAMAQESMGAIVDRSVEFLAPSDQMIVKVRRRLIREAKQFRDTGATPVGVDQPELYRMRAGGTIVPDGVDGYEACEDVFHFRSDALALP